MTTDPSCLRKEGQEVSSEEVSVEYSNDERGMQIDELEKNLFLFIVHRSSFCVYFSPALRRAAICRSNIAGSLIGSSLFVNL